MSNNLTAIDILLEPDGAMLARAKSINDFMLTSIPSPPGFALDENHRPHITVLQRYVRTGDLGRVFEEVQLLLEKVDLSALRLTSVVGDTTPAVTAVGRPRACSGSLRCGRNSFAYLTHSDRRGRARNDGSADHGMFVRRFVGRIVQWRRQRLGGRASEPVDPHEHE